jgi:hypothetical protein
MLPLHQTSRRTLLNRTVVAGLAACAIAPAGALAMPAPGGHPSTAAQEGTNLRTPDQRTGGGADITTPVPLPVPQITTVQTDLPTSTAVADDGVDTEVWIAAGAAGILLASGIGMVTRVRARRHSVA